MILAASARFPAGASLPHFVPAPLLWMSHRLVQHVALSLPVLFLKEKRTFIAYTPALALSASGSTPKKAKKNFEITLRLFVEELAEAGTANRSRRG